MDKQILIQNNEEIILPKQLIEFLKVSPGDKFNVECLDNGDIVVKKVQSFSSFLDNLNELMKESGYFEKAGLKNEEDVADFIRKLRDEKSSS